MTTKQIREVLWRYHTQEEDELVAPAYPLAIDVQHVATRGAQAGSLLGIASGSLFHAFSKDGKGFAERVGRHSARGLAGGALLMTAVGAAKFFESGPEGIEDRALRLKYNGTQNRVDRYAFLYAAVGGSIGAATGSVARGVALSVPFALAALAANAFGDL